MVSQLAEGRKLFYQGKFEEAGKIAESLSRHNLAYVSEGARFLLSRCYWAAGTKQSRGQAEEIWKSLADAKGIASPLRAKIARAIQLSDQGKDVLAVQVLEQAFGEQTTNITRAEVGIELAIAYCKTRRFDDARAALKAVETFIAEQTKIEMSPQEAAPFLDGVKLTRDRIKYYETLGLAEFEKAEKLRKDKKFAEAAKLYQRVATEFNTTHLATRAELHIGHCLLGMNQAVEAEKYWLAWISKTPSGPWRGHAMHELLRWHMETTFDLAAAEKIADIIVHVFPVAPSKCSALRWLQ